MSHSHTLYVCSCGWVIAQCACIAAYKKPSVSLVACTHAKKPARRAGALG